MSANNILKAPIAVAGRVHLVTMSKPHKTQPSATRAPAREKAPMARVAISEGAIPKS